MGSLTLQIYGIDLNSCSCTKCESAIWQAIPKFKSGSDFIPFDLKYNRDNTNDVLCCWCTLMHTFISTPRIKCDQCIEKVNFDEFIKDNNNIAS